jgi:hypothetical protein
LIGPKTPGGTKPQDHENFGFYLFLLDYDNGGSGSKDLVIHAETTNWPGPNPVAVPAAGSLYFYKNNSTTAQASVSVGSFPNNQADKWLFSLSPQRDARMGKWVALNDWKDQNGNAVKSLFVGEPEHDSASGVSNAGKIHIYTLATIANLQGNGTANHKDGDTVFSNLVPPTPPVVGYTDFSNNLPPGSQPYEGWGRWFVFGNFDGSGAPQIVVVNQGRDVFLPSLLGARGAGTMVRAKAQ